MQYKIIWKGEVIEDEIKTLKEAKYLCKEYNVAFGGGAFIERGY